MFCETQLHSIVRVPHFENRCTEPSLPRHTTCVGRLQAARRETAPARASDCVATHALHGSVEPGCGVERSAALANGGARAGGGRLRTIWLHPLWAGRVDVQVRGVVDGWGDHANEKNQVTRMTPSCTALMDELHLRF